MGLIPVPPPNPLKGESKEENEEESKEKELVVEITALAGKYLRLFFCYIYILI